MKIRREKRRERGIVDEYYIGGGFKKNYRIETK